MFISLFRKKKQIFISAAKRFTSSNDEIPGFKSRVSLLDSAEIVVPFQLSGPHKLNRNDYDIPPRIVMQMIKALHTFNYTLIGHKYIHIPIHFYSILLLRSSRQHSQFSRFGPHNNPVMQARLTRETNCSEIIQ